MSEKIRFPGKIFPIILLALLAGNLLLRLTGATSLPPNGLYNVDEKTLTDSAMYLLGGQSPVILEWPAGFSLLLLYLLYFLKALFCLLPSLLTEPGTPTLFHGFAFEIYRYNIDPWANIRLARGVFAILSLLPMLGVFLAGKHKDQPFLFLLLLSALFSPYWTIQSWSALPDSLTTGLWFFLIADYALRFQGKPRDFIRMSVLYGLILSAKLTYLAFLPVFLFIPFLHSPGIKQGTRRMGLMLACLTTTFLIFCPFLLTDTLMLLKGFVGNFLSKTQGGTGSWQSLFLTHLPGLTGWFLLAGVPLGLYFGGQFLGAKKHLLLIAACCLLILPAGNAHHVYSRYVLPLLPFLCIWAAIGYSRLLTDTRIPRRVQIIGLILSGLLILLPGIYHILGDYRLLHQPTNRQACVQWVLDNLSAHTSLSANAELQDHLLPDSVALERIISMNTDPERIAHRRTQSLELAGIPSSPSLIHNPLLIAVSDDEEAQAVFKSRISLGFEDGSRGKRFDLYYHHKFCDYYQLQVECLPEAIREFHEGGTQWFIGPEEVEGIVPAQVFDKHSGPVWYAYFQE